METSQVETEWTALSADLGLKDCRPNWAHQSGHLSVFTGGGCVWEKVEDFTDFGIFFYGCKWSQISPFYIFIKIPIYNIFIFDRLQGQFVIVSVAVNTVLGFLSFNSRQKVGSLIRGVVVSSFPSRNKKWSSPLLAHVKYNLRRISVQQLSLHAFPMILMNHQGWFTKVQRCNPHWKGTVKLGGWNLNLMALCIAALQMLAHGPCCGEKVEKAIVSKPAFWFTLVHRFLPRKRKAQSIIGLIAVSFAMLITWNFQAGMPHFQMAPRSG